MSKLGYIEKSYGSSFNISIANTYGYNVLSGNNLPINSLIVSSPVDENGNDIGSYSLLVTDYTGSPIRLTYTISEGNGIVYSDDHLKVNIDNDTIIENENKELSLDLRKLIDGNILKYDETSKKIYIDYDNLDKADIDKSGIFKIDGKTIKISDGVIFVDTSSLQYSNTSTFSTGTVIGDGKLINADQGVISLNQDNLSKGSNTNYGVISSSDDTISIYDGIVSVNTENLDKCTNTSQGIVLPDNHTINIDENGLKVNTDNLSHVTKSAKGVFKYDPKSLTVIDGKLSFKDNDVFMNTLDSFSSIEENIKKIDEDIKYLLNDYQVGISKPSILDFHCAQLLTGVLEKPIKYNESVDEMPMQFMSVVFMIATNCPFKISLTFTDNIDPQFSLHEINYNDSFINKGNEALETVYQTTEGKTIPLKFTFIGKNYYNADKSNFSNKIKIKIVVSYANDGNVFKEILYSIIRYNSGYTEEITYDDKNIENININTK